MNWKKVTIRYAGVSYEIGFGDFGFTQEPTDAQMKEAVGFWLSHKRGEMVDLDCYTFEFPEQERLSNMHSDKIDLAMRPFAAYT